MNIQRNITCGIVLWIFESRTTKDGFEVGMELCIGCVEFFDCGNGVNGQTNNF